MFHDWWQAHRLEFYLLPVWLGLFLTASFLLWLTRRRR